MTLFADVTASVDLSVPQPGTDEPMPSIQSAVIQSTAEAEAPQTAKDVPTSEISASEPASQTQAENSETSEALFREFQAWKAKQDARDLAKPVQDDWHRSRKMRQNLCRPCKGSEGPGPCEMRG